MTFLGQWLILAMYLRFKGSNPVTSQLLFAATYNDLYTYIDVLLLLVFYIGLFWKVLQTKEFARNTLTEKYLMGSFLTCKICLNAFLNVFLFVTFCTINLFLRFMAEEPHGRTPQIGSWRRIHGLYLRKKILSYYGYDKKMLAMIPLESSLAPHSQKPNQQKLPQKMGISWSVMCNNCYGWLNTTRPWTFHNPIPSL